jgi:AraC-like DNA-binding protein
MSPAYTEFPPPLALEPLVSCLWENEPDKTTTQRIIPDGCLDLIWFGGQLVIAGADTGPRFVELTARERLSGVRLRPGAAAAVLGLPATELRDRMVPLELVWPREAAQLEEAVAVAPPAERLHFLAAATASRGASPDHLVAAAARGLAAPGARVATVAADLGVSERHLHRRVLAAIGYGPKTLARVARLRRLIALGNEPLAQRALAAGYASQAHMNEEVRRLTGATPVRFLKDAVLTTA